MKTYAPKQLRDMSKNEIKALCGGRPKVEFFEYFERRPELSGVLLNIIMSNGYVTVVIASSKGYGDNGNEEKNGLREAKVNLGPNMALQIV